MPEDETKSTSAESTTTAAVDDKASSSAGDEEPVFPPPKYIVTIVSPRTLLLHDNDASLDEWKEFKQSASAEAAATSVLNLHVLLVSLLNRLLRARLFPRRAVHSFLTPAAGAEDHEWVVFSILTPAKVLPILLSKCEHFGVGNLVGLVYACPIETCVLPLLRPSIDEEEEEQGLLTVPSMLAQRAPLAPANSVVGTVISTSSTAPLAPMADSTSVLVMAPNHQKKPSLVPDPASIRPVRSETIPDAEADVTEPLEDARTNGLQRRHSHQDVLQSVQVDEKKKEETKKEDKTPILEEIPEAKSSKTVVRIDLEGKESDHTGGDLKKVDSIKPNKSVLIGKVLEARKEWLATASRIRVEQVAEEVTAAAALTWDYMLFVACAAAIAATGLATDSSVTVLASMLVSPIMGPVLAVTFGTMIRRRTMIQKALRNEAISLLMCIFVGAFGALVVWWTRLYESSDWPSEEMLARGKTTGLASGVLIALPSGMATALSTLARNSSGLVGVAISLSLLPPAVNAGLCWMFAILDSTRLVDKEPDDDTNYWKVGSTSFGLTLLNILCIWLAGVFTFWLKEVAPIERKSAFWSRDLKIARQPPKEVGSGKIKDGLQAAIDLKKNFGTEIEDDLTVKTTHDLRARRMSTPTTRWENALMLDRTRDDAVPRRPVGIDRASSEGILERAEALGGMDKASEVLFSNSIFNADGESMFGSSANQDPAYRDVINFSYHPESPEAVPPRDVYEEFLWQRYRNPKM